jgi:glycosyltransferase involved in cell wall biosynthesis
VLGGVQFTVPYQGDRLPVYLAPPLYTRLERGGFDTAIVGGWNHLECYWTLLWARRNGRRVALWSETPLLDEFPRRPFRSALKRRVVRSAETFVVPGPSAGRYLATLGAPSERIYIAPNAVDVDFWSADVQAQRPEPGARPLILLFVGRLVRSKGVEIAFAAYAASRLAGSATFLVAGDGPDRSRLERSAPPGVRFLGDQNRESLRLLYGSSDMLVFPSLYDPWGLVLNEAACTGLATIASDQAGGTRDLIRDGENGLVVRGGNVDALRAAFDRLADDPELPARLGRAARRIADTHTPEACARGFAAAVT